MMSFQRIGRDASGTAKSGSLISALTMALLLGGCSADVGRFDFPSFNLNGNSGSTGTLPTPAEPMSGGGSSLSDAGDRSSSGDGGDTYIPPRSRNGSVDVAALPDASSPVATPRPMTTTPTFGGNRYEPPRANYQPNRAAAPIAVPVADRSGESIEVQRGDTLYALARRHGVKVNDLMAANGLSSATIHPGQKLRMPGQTGVAMAAPVMPRGEQRTRTAAVERPVLAPAADTAQWGGSYTVQSGDSLYRIARANNIRVSELQSANGITNPRQLKPGLVLRIPGSGGATPTLAQAAREEVTAAPRMIQSTTQPTVINGGERQVAALNTGRVVDAPPRVQNDAKPVQTVAITPGQIAAGTLRWPSKGKIVSGFGQRPDGTHNDGINIAVPQGAPVHAAEDGEVAYAGSELKGYGNLILVRHDNGWVTAYAHSEEMLVKRGDKVRRGDVIAKAGKTGQVDQPQLHFELRQGSKPVDPLPYLDRL